MPDSRLAKSVYATLRITSENRNPLEVIKCLKVPYDHIHQRNEPRLRRNENGAIKEYAPYTQSMFSIYSAPWVDSPSLDAHIAWLLEQIEPRRVQLQVLFETGWSGDIFCFSSSGSQNPPRVESEIIRRTQSIGLEIDVDHYQDDINATALEK